MPESCPAFPDDHHDLLKRTVKIVVSYISNNKIPVQDMGKLVKSVYDALNGAHSVEHEQEPQKKPGGFEKPSGFGPFSVIPSLV
ncbi:MucR family transcriptional regulator [Komagataeibacter saccharivorans]|uniref:MucR family transcriptional regulator n=1 Tax=Komagataeibacter saccharivorans TaxID=265959 RepID=UPI0024A9D436|nr:MucR family transcriptional regulator [Komagataeibacter saccharivorans]